MWNKKIFQKNINSLANLEPADYKETDPQMASIYSRLQNGRNSFANVFHLNVDAVAQISALDLEIKYYIDQLLKIADDIKESSSNIYESASDATSVAGIVSENHEELTHTILRVSEASSNVLTKIETGQGELTTIRELSNNTIMISEEMHQDMEDLASVIGEMTKVIEGINAISSQTNMLSLNASIEASRAGEAGRGFAVVADEIRSLADETRQLTKTMGEFVEGVRSASSKSAESVEKAIDALKTVNEKIGDVWNLNEDNQQHVADITDSISNLAAVSEEISSSMNEIEARSAEIEESCKNLAQDSVSLNSIGNCSAQALIPLEKIEGGVDNLLVKMGKMSVDPFYALSRIELIAYLDKAIQAHKGWIGKLGDIVKERNILPIQFDGNKCHFGHFFNSIEPPIPELKAFWNEIGSNHAELHKMGRQIVENLFSGDETMADQIYEEAVKKSTYLISLIEKLKGMVPERSSELTRN